MLFVMVFFNFLFFRIMSAAMFDDPLTIWATALTAICVAFVQAIAGPVATAYAMSDEPDQWKPEYYLSVSLVVIAACGVACLAAYLISLGFSDRLYQDISNWRYRRDLWEQDIFWFCVMISIPVFVHAVLYFRVLNKRD